MKELERLGIGRPSTYASIISTLTDRHYAELEQRRFFPTPLGESVEKVMIKQFPHEFNVGFTADMEAELDKVEEGKLGWQRVLKEFYGPFDKALSAVDYEGLIQEAHDLSALAGEKCPQCGGKLVAKGGFFGPFVACEHHPKTCTYTRPLKGERQPPVLTEYPCPLCGKMMVVRRGRSGLGGTRAPRGIGGNRRPELRLHLHVLGDTVVSQPLVALGEVLGVQGVGIVESVVEAVPGEQLVGSGPVAAGDTVRWMEVDAAACAFLDQCAAGATLADAVSACLEVKGNTDLARLMAGLLAGGAFGAMTRA